MTPEELAEIRARFDAQKYITEAEIGGLFAALDAAEADNKILVKKLIDETEEHQGEKAVWLEDRRQWERTANDLATQLTAMREALERSKGHAAQIDQQILLDIVAVRKERDDLAAVLRAIIKDDPDWLEVPEVAAAYEAIQS